jgi:NDP-sugar pyrophosphorylase family protein
MNQLKTINLYNFNETIARDLLETEEYPWAILPKIADYILKLGETLSLDIFDQVSQSVWIAKSATVAPSASITGPCIIDENAEIRHCAFIRGNAIIGKGAVVGNSSELKNCILFNRVQTPHYNYVGDSILGFKSHMGAGSITSNVKGDGSLVKIKANGTTIETGLKKVGAMLGDHVEVGCSTVLNPGTVVGRNTAFYPLSMVRGFIPENKIFKSQDDIVDKA